MLSEIVRYEEDLRQAMLLGDVGALTEMIDDSLVFLTPLGDVATKSMDLEAYQGGEQKISELLPFDEDIRVHGDMAVVTVRIKLVGTYGDADISGSYRYLRVWKKDGPHWKIVAGSVVRIADF